ncbi:MAG: PadR family transcriptional regulator [Oscillospiraceae bacterium]|nr:PadR family transcriptional regulator [Oscillospiraceae bacterium]
MVISSDMIYGHTDSIILRNLLEGDNYGYEINRAILEKSAGRFELKEATLYTAFRRLEKDGYIRAYWGDEDSSGGGRRRYYSITEAGRERFAQRMQEWQDIKELMDMLFA